MPKVSIIVPVYNTEKYLARCIDSILAQTFTDFELILVNDGSKDNSGKICDEYAQKDSRIVVIHKENGGVSSARNKGIDIAQGEWISFVDSDDWIDSNYIAQFQLHNSDIQICGFNKISSTVEKITPKKDQTYSKADIPYIINEQFKHMYLRGILSKFFKNSVISNNQIKFDCNLRIGEDTLFILQYLIHCSTVHFIAKAGYNYECIQTTDKYKLSVEEYGILLLH